MVSHLLFANDTVILYEAIKVEILSWVFMVEPISCLKINLEKSELVLVGGLSMWKV